MVPDDAWIDRVTQTACHHVSEGYSQDQAIDMAINRHVGELRGQRGLGQTTDPTQDPNAVAATDQAPSLFQQASSDVKSVSTVISPWLWILSVGGFIMGVVSKYEISKMYGSYKRMKSHLRHP